MKTTINRNDFIIDNKHITIQNEMLEQCAEKLTIATKKNKIHHKEKEINVSKLDFVNTLLIFEINEKEKRAEELVIANKKLVFENCEKQKRAEELAIANRKLIFESIEKEKRAEELAIANFELIKAENLQEEHIQTLEEMMFMISHKVRHPVANILGISYLLQESKDYSSPEFTKNINNIIDSAASLNVFTQELSALIHKKRSTSKL